MNLIDILKQHNFPQGVLDAYTATGISSLHPPQIEAVHAGLLDDRNLLLAVPTASGKTLMAELCMLKSILKNRGRCIYIAPLKALASEKYREFNERFSALGIRVGIAIGDLDSPSTQLDQYDIIVATAEKVDSLLRSKARWLIEALNVMVLDEVHCIDDESRGPTLEVLASRIKQLNSSIQILALSATVSNAGEIASWLDATLVQSNWRPIPLSEGVFLNNTIYFADGKEHPLDSDIKHDVARLTVDTILSGGQTLVFVNSRRSTQSVARDISKYISPHVSEESHAVLNKAADAITKRADATQMCHKLADCLRKGCAFHHAGLKPEQREAVEDCFKKNHIKVIVATPTLAAGVNLPARRTILRDCKRYAGSMGQVYIPVSEYKQCAGRAGRPQYDAYGEAVMMAKTDNEMDTFFERFILAEPEPISSKLSNESTLRKHILSSIAGGYIFDINGMFEFINHTFLAHQKNTPNLLDSIGNIFETLCTEGFITKSGFRFFPTPFGALTSRLYIDPVSAMTLRDGLQIAHDTQTTSVSGLLHLTSCCPDSPFLSVGKKDYEELNDFAMKVEDELFLNSSNVAILEDYYTYCSSLKTTWMLLNWIEEETEDTICTHFNIGPGDIFRHVESTRWLLYAAGQIAHLQQLKNLSFTISDLKTRIQYGIKDELLKLISIKGVGRIRARVLHDQGYTTYDHLKRASISELAGIKQIGKKLAGDILLQVSTPNKR